MTDQEAFTSLRDILISLYPDEASAQRIVDDAGLDRSLITFSANAKNNWHAILKTAENKNKVKELINVVIGEYKDNPTFQTASDAYLNYKNRNQPKRSIHESSSVNGISYITYFLLFILSILLLTTLTDWELTRKVRGQLYYYLGTYYHNAEQYDLAISSYNKLINEIDSNYGSAYLGRGLSYSKQKHYDLAMRDFSKAIELDPDLAEAYYYRGLIYRDQNELYSAVADLKAAQNLDNQNTLNSESLIQEILQDMLDPNLSEKVINEIRDANRPTRYKEQAVIFVNSLFAHLDDFDLNDIGNTEARMREQLAKDGIGERIGILVEKIWDDWVRLAKQQEDFSLNGADPESYDLSPFKVLVIKMIQARQKKLTLLEQIALRELFIQDDKNSIESLIAKIETTTWPGSIILLDLPPLNDTRCQNLVQNPSFESLDSWSFGEDPVPPRYNNVLMHSGARSILLGNLQGVQDDNKGYSSFRQLLTIPSGAKEARLRWWRYTGTNDTGAISDINDSQDLILLTPNSLMPSQILRRELRDSQVWAEDVVDLIAWRGQSFYIYFQVYNDGDGFSTWMYLDDISLEVCDSQ